MEDASSTADDKADVVMTSNGTSSAPSLAEMGKKSPESPTPLNHNRAAGGSPLPGTKFKVKQKKRKRKHVTSSGVTGGYSSSSGESSSEDDDEDRDATLPLSQLHDDRTRQQQQQQQVQPDGWRVKLYRLCTDGSWDDCGTGRIVCLYRGNKSGSHATTEHHHHGEATAARPDEWLYQELGEATLCVRAENPPGDKQQPAESAPPIPQQAQILLRTRIILRDSYQRQGENIITWTEPYYKNMATDDTSGSSPNNSGRRGDQDHGGVDLALSFQDNQGCMDIWKQITRVQAKARERLRQVEGTQENTAAHIVAQHPASLRLQNSADSANDTWTSGKDNEEILLQQQQQIASKLPSPPTLQNLEETADTIAALQHIQQREVLALYIAKDECAYLKALLALFPEAEEGNDYGKLATLAACVKTILLLNEPAILELIVGASGIFEDVCMCLEYDPDLREKANHRWFLRERAKFRTVVPMEDAELVSAIHRTFRVHYLRDTLLRPTMDEASLSTLKSLETFTHGDVVKGVTRSSDGQGIPLQDSYLSRVIRMLGVELQAICAMEWSRLSTAADGGLMDTSNQEDFHADPSIVVGSLEAATWKQYLAPQDGLLASRQLRRRGSLSFLKELFNMVRLSLQQAEKDNFFSVICSMKLELTQEDQEIADNVSQTSQQVEVGSIASMSVASTIRSDRMDDKPETHITAITTDVPVNLLSLLGNVLADPAADTTEKGLALEIIAGVALHDPSLIRFHCIDYQKTKKKRELEGDGIDGLPYNFRPEPNEKKQVLFICPPDDLLAALVFQLSTCTDAGILLQVSEIFRIILDTDVVSEHVATNVGFTDESEEGIAPGGSQNPPHDQHSRPVGTAAISTDQKQFLSFFYDLYIDWLVAPFLYTVVRPVKRIPDAAFTSPGDFPFVTKLLSDFQDGLSVDYPLTTTVLQSAVRSSFAVELLSFCVRAHLYRMKQFLLSSRVMRAVSSLLRTRQMAGPGERCLKLAALRFLRAVLSVNDEFYHRHIIQQDLFAPVFEALRNNPVGDNLISSSIVELCDFIMSEKVQSLLEYIVTKHLSKSPSENGIPSLEDVSGPYVTTLTVLREAYEESLANRDNNNRSGNATPRSPTGARAHHEHRHLTGRALEDQRKFEEHDKEEDYFESDNGVNGEASSPSVPSGVDELAVADGQIHCPPRVFSFAQTHFLNHHDDRVDTSPPADEKSRRMSI